MCKMSTQMLCTVLKCNRECKCNKCNSESIRVFLQIVNDCNEGARKMERMEEICVLQTQIEFKTKVRKHSLEFYDIKRRFKCFVPLQYYGNFLKIMVIGLMRVTSPAQNSPPSLVCTKFLASL